MNHVSLLGRLTRDPELSYSNATGNAMVRFSVAVDRRLSREKRQELEAKNQPTADFINCVCWGRLAETIANFTAKGKRVAIDGRIQTNSYTDKDGNRRYPVDVVVENIEFIDWKDRDYNSRGNGQGGDNRRGSFPENKAATGDQGEGDDFFSADFSPVDDDRIPF